MKYDQRHGGPYDRGSADAWYGRPRRPHYFSGGTYMSPEYTEEQMSAEDIAAYNAGYDEQDGRKNYG